MCSQYPAAAQLLTRWLTAFWTGARCLLQPRLVTSSVQTSSSRLPSYRWYPSGMLASKSLLPAAFACLKVLDQLLSCSQLRPQLERISYKWYPNCSATQVQLELNCCQT